MMQSILFRSILLAFMLLPVLASAAEVNIQVRVFLEGPYTGGNQMKSAYLQASNSSEKFASLYSTLALPSYTQALADANPQVLSNTIDLVEVLLIPVSGKGQVATSIAFLQSDGRVVSGKGQAVNLNVGEGSYYVSVKHRNHLPIVAQQTVQVAGSTPINIESDLTVAANLHKSAAYVIIDGKATAIAGELHGELSHKAYEINAMDLSVAIEAIAAGALVADFNLDGKVDSKDFDLVAKNNDELFATQLP